MVGRKLPDSWSNYWFMRNSVLELGVHSQWKIIKGRKKPFQEKTNFQVEIQILMSDLFAWSKDC